MFCSLMTLINFPSLESLSVSMPLEISCSFELAAVSIPSCSLETVSAGSPSTVNLLLRLRVSSGSSFVAIYNFITKKIYIFK